MKVGSLFAGIGGFDIAAKEVGWSTVWFSEIDQYASLVLAERFPGVLNLGDITKIKWGGVEPVDVLVGGFPCQDISHAGFRAGIDGLRSGLWAEFVRAIRELRPRYVVVENVAALLADGSGLRVLGDLAGLRYDAEWSTVSACAVGAPHMRRRVFVVAYPNSVNGRQRVRDSVAQEDRSLSRVHRFARARADWQARMANPSELYGGADGLPAGLERNRAIGNAIVPACAIEGPFERIKELEAERVA
jgi:DNA (cytosine-5)-methyltransferase 1